MRDGVILYEGSGRENFICKRINVYMGKPDSHELVCEEYLPINTDNIDKVDDDYLIIYVN